jgi:hypothetical protein
VRHFDRGSQAFLAQHQPLTQELIVMTTRKSWQACQKRKDTSIAITAHQLAQAKGIASRKVTSTITEVWKNEKYGHAPREKPTHLIQIAMENFNSLCICLGNAKITAINNLCQDFKVDLLCGCETQIDWRQVPQARKFHNLFGVGTETSSIMAHNINKRMQPNQFGE